MGAQETGKSFPTILPLKATQEVSDVIKSGAFLDDVLKQSQQKDWLTPRERELVHPLRQKLSDVIS